MLLISICQENTIYFEITHEILISGDIIHLNPVTYIRRWSRTKLQHSNYTHITTEEDIFITIFAVHYSRSIVQGISYACGVTHATSLQLRVFHVIDNVLCLRFMWWSQILIKSFTSLINVRQAGYYTAPLD